jgi:hypothetical protein
MISHTVDLSCVATWPEFIEAFNAGFIRHFSVKWNGHMDAFHDYLWWPDKHPYRLLLRGWEQCFDSVNGFRHHSGHRILEMVLDSFKDNPQTQVVFVPQPVPEFDVRWRTEPVEGIAARMDETGEVTALPILADALEEAGCPLAEVLTPCREPITPETGRWIALWCLGRL